jgi:hypothetical protein
MAEPTPVLTPPDPVLDDVYRPLSALAVSSIVVAGAYATLLTMLSLVAFATSTPLFLAIWTIVVPALGLLLAVLGRLRIRSSEGVLSGMVLTTWAWWLSLLFGLGYIAYYVGAYLAVSSQAETFTNEWFFKIRDGKIADAFLETQEPAKRKGINPADTDLMMLRFGMSRTRGKAPMVAFQDQDVIRLVQRAGPDLKVTPLGVKSWEYDKGGYQVAEIYQLETPEGVFEVSVTVRSGEGPELEGRKWYVLPQGPQFPLPVGAPRFTRLGRTLEKWYRPAHDFAAEWVKKRNDGDSVGVFLDTLTPQERQTRRQENEGRLVLGTFFLGSDWAAKGLPGFTDSTKLLRTEGFQALTKDREEIRNIVTQHFRDRTRILLRPPESRGWWKFVDSDKGVLQAFLPVALLVQDPGKDAAAAPRYICDAAVILESEPGEVSTERDPGWRVVGVQLIRGSAPQAAPGPPGPGEAMGN